MSGDARQESIIDEMGRAYDRHSRMAMRHRHAAAILWSLYWQTPAPPGVHRIRVRAKYHESRADYHDSVFN